MLCDLSADDLRGVRNGLSVCLDQELHVMDDDASREETRGWVMTSSDGETQLCVVQ